MNAGTAKVLFSAESTEWETPHDLFKYLDDEFHFTIDVCATGSNTKCREFYSPEQDALKQDWKGVCWMNPPYGEPETACEADCRKKKCEKRGRCTSVYIPGCSDFIKKARESAAAGATVVALLPSRTETRWWHDYIWDRDKHKPQKGIEVRFLKGRLKFHRAPSSAPFPSVIIVFQPGKANVPKNITPAML